MHYSFLSLYIAPRLYRNYLPKSKPDKQSRYAQFISVYYLVCLLKLSEICYTTSITFSFDTVTIRNPTRRNGSWANFKLIKRQLDIFFFVCFFFCLNAFIKKNKMHAAIHSSSWEYKLNTQRFTNKLQISRQELSVKNYL